MSPAGTSENSGLTFKELALYIGIPIGSVCIAGGLYYIYKRSSAIDSVDTTPKDEEDGGNKVTIEPVIEDPKAKAQAAKSRGNKYFQGSKFEKAIQLYTEAIELCPPEDAADISTFYQNRAAANEKLERWTEVAADCTKAIELNPKYSKALHRRAKAFEELNRKRECLEDVTAICLLDGFQNQQCMILADRILKSIGKERAAEHFPKREFTLPSSFFVKSYLDSFNEDIFAIPYDDIEDDDSVYSKITKNIAKQEYKDISSLCAKEIESDGKYKNHALLLRGTLRTLMCDVDNAMKDFDLILDLEDNDTNKKLKVDALIKRASLKMQQVKDKECYADLTLAIEIDADNPNIYHHRGQLYFLTERLEEAKADFKKSIELDANFVAPRIQLSYCLCKIAMQQMNPTIMKESSDMLDETTRLFPECVEAWSLYGQLLQDQQKLPEASEKLEKAISLAPTNPTTYVYKALLLLQWKQDLEGANKLIRKAVDLDDKCDFAYETLATLEVQKGNNEEAIRLFEKAIELVRTEAEMANTFSLLEAAKAQSKVTKLYGIKLPQGIPPGM